MISARTMTSVPAVSGGGRSDANHELLIAGALFAALVIVGTAFFFAVAPGIANLGSLYDTTT